MYPTQLLTQSNPLNHSMWREGSLRFGNLQTNTLRCQSGVSYLSRRPSDRSSGWAHPTSPFTRSSSADPFTRSSFARSAGEEAGGLQEGADLAGRQKCRQTLGLRHLDPEKWPSRRRQCRSPAHAWPRQPCATVMSFEGQNEIWVKS